MSWIEPKTDWAPSDYYNVADYNRQIHNIGYITNEILPTLAYQADFDPGMPLDRTDMPTKDSINHIEQGLEAIENCGLPMPSEWLPGKTWESGGIAPDYTDANRWEGNVLAIYNMAQRIAAEWPRMGTFESGGILI